MTGVQQTSRQNACKNPAIRRRLHMQIFRMPFSLPSSASIPARVSTPRRLPEPRFPRRLVLQPFLTTELVIKTTGTLNNTITKIQLSNTNFSTSTRLNSILILVTVQL